MSLHAGRAKLNDALKKLLADWHDVRSQWNDDASQRFFDAHVAPLEKIVRSTLGAMDQMAAVLHQAQRDCGE